jgi:type II secretory pathway component PulK
MTMNRQSTSATPARHPRGTALVAVLWLIAILAMACMAALRVISFDMELATQKIHGSRAGHMAEAGIAIGSNPVVERDDPILKFYNPDTDEGYEVELISEGGRFNINAILQRDDTVLLRSLFIDWGLDLDTAQALVDALADWVDADDETRLNGAESDWYESRGRTNQPFNRPFYDISEMRLVRDMDLIEALRPDWRDWFTIWSSGLLDINEARAELIAAAAEVSIEQASAIPQIVNGADGILGTEDDAPFADVGSALAIIGINAEARPDIAARFTTGDTTTRVVSTGYASSAKRRITAILRNRTGQPALLERTEEIIP